MMRTDPLGCKSLGSMKPHEDCASNVARASTEWPQNKLLSGLECAQSAWSRVVERNKLLRARFENIVNGGVVVMSACSACKCLLSVAHPSELAHKQRTCLQCTDATCASLRLCLPTIGQTSVNGL